MFSSAQQKLVLPNLGLVISKYRENMVSWLEMDPRFCRLACLNKTQMREMAEENNLSIPSSLRVDEYRKRLGNALSGDPQDFAPQDNLIQSLTKAMISASFLKPPQSNTEVSKHTILGLLGSVDAVLLVKDKGTKLAIPVEGKGRVTTNTGFH